MKTICSLIVISISANALAQTQSAEHAAVQLGTNVLQVTPALLNDLADEMRERNPALQAARARTNAATAGISARIAT